VGGTAQGDAVGEIDHRALGRRLSNWGRWGTDDVLGTINLIRPEHRVAAARLVSEGATFPLALPLDAEGPQIGTGSRQNPIHIMTRTPSATELQDRFHWFDDAVFMYLQAATQLDGLAHIAIDGLMYGGRSIDEVTREGVGALGVEAFADRIAGRGVLLDIARLRGVDRLEAGSVITAAELEAAERAQGLRVGEGDILLVRTGWIRTFTIERDRDAFHAAEPGLGLDTAAWLHERGVAFLAADNWGVEVSPPEIDAEMPLHVVWIRDMGLPLGEMFDLEALAAHAAASGRWEFHFTCPVLPFTGGVGAPVQPVATF